MKIAFDGRVLSQSNITGVQRYTACIYEQLETLLNGELKLFLPGDNAHKASKHLWEQFVLPSEVKKWGGDILFCPGNVAPINKKNFKLITVIHDLSYKYYPAAYSMAFRAYYNALIPIVLKNSDRIVTVSMSEREQILKYYPGVAEKIDVLYNGIGDAFYDEYVTREPIVLYVGSLSKRKNYQGVLKAFSKICRCIPHKLVLIGVAGDVFKAMDQETTTALKNIPNDRILFLGQVNDSNVLRSWFSRADLFVFPSFYESFGLPPLEAMACGCPVLVSDIPALRETCGDAAAFCTPASAADIIDKMLSVLGDKELKKSMSQRGIERASKFKWESTAVDLVNIFRSCID